MALGGMTAAELAERMSVAEYWRWASFSAVEPFPSDRIDLAGAIVATTMSNIHRGKNGAVRKLDDFLLVRRALDRQEEYKDDRETAHLQTTIALLGGKV